MMGARASRAAASAAWMPCVLITLTAGSAQRARLQCANSSCSFAPVTTPGSSFMAVILPWADFARDATAFLFRFARTRKPPRFVPHLRRAEPRAAHTHHQPRPRAFAAAKTPVGVLGCGRAHAE